MPQKNNLKVKIKLVSPTSQYQLRLKIYKDKFFYFLGGSPFTYLKLTELY